MERSRKGFGFCVYHFNYNTAALFFFMLIYSNWRERGIKLKICSVVPQFSSHNKQSWVKSISIFLFFFNLSSSRDFFLFFFCYSFRWDSSKGHKCIFDFELLLLPRHLLESPQLLNLIAFLYKKMLKKVIFILLYRWMDNDTSTK